MCFRKACLATSRHLLYQETCPMRCSGGVWIHSSKQTIFKSKRLWKAVIFSSYHRFSMQVGWWTLVSPIPVHLFSYSTLNYMVFAIDSSCDYSYHKIWYEKLIVATYSEYMSNSRLCLCSQQLLRMPSVCFAVGLQRVWRNSLPLLILSCNGNLLINHKSKLNQLIQLYTLTRLFSK